MSSPIVSRISSGITEIDRLWSGLYSGGTYLVYGRTADGRSILPLMFADEGCNRKETCLFIATDRPRSLIIHASLIGFDIKDANKNNLLKLVRFPTLSESRGISDDARANTLSQLLDLVRKNTPTRLVINDLTPFVQFESSDRFRKEMVALLDGLDELNVTSMIALPEPANVHSQRVISFLRRQVVGSLHVEKNNKGGADQYSLSLIPNVGHITQEYSVDWNLAEIIKTRTAVNTSSDFESSSSTEAIALAPEENPESRGQLSSDEFIHVDSEIVLDHSTLNEEEIEFELQNHPDIISHLGDSIDRADHDVDEDIDRDGADSTESISDETSMNTVDDHVDDHVDDGGVSADDNHVSPTIDLSEADATKLPYSEQIVSELNKELAGLVQPYEVVTPESRQGAVMPEVHSERESFAGASDFYFDSYRQSQEPFLLIGVRLDRTPSIIPRKFDFEFVSEISQQLLRSYDLILIDEERQNLVVLLAASTETGADDFFKRLRAKLLEEAPNQAENLMQSVSAIVALNGNGFQSCRDFLSYIDSGK